MLTQFSVGQIWTYATRDCEPNSRMTIVRLDEDPDFGTIVHVFVSGVSIPNAEAPGGVTTFIAHLPYSEEALENACSNSMENPVSYPTMKTPTNFGERHLSRTKQAYSTIR